MNRRLQMLTELVESGRADSFARYALALEYKKEGLIDEALAAFEALRASDPDYLAMYYMTGQLLLEMDREDAAREWFSAGAEVARQRGDGKTQSELEAALAEI